jgi:hypothetical protein
MERTTIRTAQDFLRRETAPLFRPLKMAIVAWKLFARKHFWQKCHSKFTKKKKIQNLELRLNICGKVGAVEPHLGNEDEMFD